MTESELIYAATYGIGKDYDYEQLSDCDLLNGKGDVIDDVWEYVTQYKENGSAWFKEEYAAHKMHWAI
jgi:hypothetical protein